MGIKLADDMNFLIYDELELKFEGDFIFEEEILFGEFAMM